MKFDLTFIACLVCVMIFAFWEREDEKQTQLYHISTEPAAQRLDPYRNAYIPSLHDGYVVRNIEPTEKYGQHQYILTLVALDEEHLADNVILKVKVDTFTAGLFDTLRLTNISR